MRRVVDEINRPPVPGEKSLPVIRSARQVSGAKSPGVDQDRSTELDTAESSFEISLGYQAIVVGQTNAASLSPTQSINETVGKCYPTVSSSIL